jgi:hypothetical protein
VNHIIYILDSLTPTSLIKSLTKRFSFKKKANYIDNLSNKSIYFNNVYGYGETYGTTFPMFTGKNFYDIYGDAPDIFYSFLSESNIGSHYKARGYNNIFYRNCAPDADVSGFYGRYLKNITKDFDTICIRKKNPNYSFSNFLNENNLINRKNKKNFYLIHDMSLHDSAYFRASLKDYIKCQDKSAEIVKKNLELINYNPKKDFLFFLSDHGLTPHPEVKIFFDDKLKTDTYNKYYQKLFDEEKIKQTFFIKTPKNTKLNISEKITSQNIYKIIKIFSKKNYKDILLKKKNIFFKKFLFYTSVKDALKSPYNSKFVKNLYHCHFIFFKGEKKYIYSHNYPKRYLKENNNKYISLRKDEVPKEFLSVLSSYFGNFNFIKKFFLFYLSFCILVFNKILKIIFKFNLLKFKRLKNC